tara:strand:+ start:26585 stop:27118 length:534 start_codon:yes stop_codon:yes gene_type:complete
LTLFSILSGTPVWVWLMLAFILYRGLKATRPRQTSLHAPLLMPAIMFISSLTSHARQFTDPDLSGLLWLATLAVGGIIGGMLASRLKINVDPGPPVILHRPGSWISFLLILAIFLTQYIFGVINATQPLLANSPTTILLHTMLLGLFNGLFLGRGLAIFHFAKKHQRTFLSSKKHTA